MADEDNEFESYDLVSNQSKKIAPKPIENKEVKQNDINDHDIPAMKEDEDDLKDYDRQLTPPNNQNTKLFSNNQDINNEMDYDIKEVNDEDDDYLADNDDLKAKAQAKIKKTEQVQPIEKNTIPIDEQKDKDKDNDYDMEYDGMVSHDEYDTGNKKDNHLNIKEIPKVENYKDKKKEGNQPKILITQKTPGLINDQNIRLGNNSNNNNNMIRDIKNNLTSTLPNNNNAQFRKLSPTNRIIKSNKYKPSYLKLQQKNYQKKFIYQPLSPNNISQVPLSRFDFAESKYSQLRSEIEKLINTPVTTDENGYCDSNEQNSLMLQYLSILNTIVGDMTENSRVTYSRYNNNKTDSFNTSNNTSLLTNVRQSTSLNNSKILDRYRAELLTVQARYNQITDSSYESRINQEIIDSKVQIAYFEKENKQLRNNQKVSEVFLQQQNKPNPKSQMEIKRIEMDHKNLTNQYESMIAKVEKNRQAMKDNEARLVELKKWKDKIEQNAKEECAILKNKDEIDNCNRVYYLKNKEVNRLLQDNKILDKVFETNKKRFMNELILKEKTVIEKEKKRRELDNILKEKTIQLDKLDEMIQLYRLQHSTPETCQEIKKEDDNNNLCNDDMNELLIQKEENQPTVHISSEDLPKQITNNDNNFTIQANEFIDKQNNDTITPQVIKSLDEEEQQTEPKDQEEQKEDSEDNQKNIVEKKEVKQYNNELILPLIPNPNERKGYYENNDLHPNQVPFNPIQKAQTTNTLNERKSTQTIHSEHKAAIEYEYEKKPSRKTNEGNNQGIVIPQQKPSNQKMEKITHELDDYAILHLATKKGNDIIDNDLSPHKNDYQKKKTYEDSRNQKAIQLQEEPSPLNHNMNNFRNNNQRRTIEEAQYCEDEIDEDENIIIQENPSDGFREQ